MRTWPALLLLLGALLVPAAAAAQPFYVDVRNGESLYDASCLSCHGVAGAGVLKPRREHGAYDVNGQGPPLRDVGALSADFYLRTGYMPIGSAHDQPVRRRSPFSDEQIGALVAYVSTLGKGPAVPKPHPERGNVAAGLTSFTQHCAGCHQVAAQGGFVTGARVPPLDHASPVQIAEAVRIGPYVMPRFSKQQISDGELDSIIAYVQTTKHPNDSGGWAIGHVGPVPEGIVTWLIAAAVLVAVCLAIGERRRA